ncbi:MAG TPA: cytochrome c family protein, partial [Caulobacteraceae bacterium]|nr:cytochrome c family protein [Caulobacteraceae bacterium]
PAKPGYAVDVPQEAGGEAAVADVPPDWGTVLPKADVAAGQAKADAVCASCHKFDPAGTNAIGPGLFGVLGRPPGSHPGFAYSDAMKAFGAKTPKWDYDHVYEFVHGPGKFIPGTKMTYAGLKSPEDRVNIIAYLHTLGSSLPVPAPKPAAAAAAPAAGAAVAEAGKAGTAPTPPAAGAPSAAEPAKPGGAPGGPAPLATPAKK